MEAAGKTGPLVPKAPSDEKYCCHICHVFEAKQCESVMFVFPLMLYLWHLLTTLYNQNME